MAAFTPRFLFVVERALRGLHSTNERDRPHFFPFQGASGRRLQPVQMQGFLVIPQMTVIWSVSNTGLARRETPAAALPHTGWIPFVSTGAFRRCSPRSLQRPRPNPDLPDSCVSMTPGNAAIESQVFAYMRIKRSVPHLDHVCV